MEYIQDTLFGKMYPEHSVQTKEKTLDVSLNHCAESLTKKFMCLRLTNGNKQDVSWGDISQLLGEYWMLNIGESPKEENASTLSQILQANVPQKYYLSRKACLGILRRASNRGKELPEVLRVALERQASLDKEAYANISDGSNAMKSANPHSGIYEADTSRTIDGNGGNPGCNQCGIAVVCVDQGGGKSSCSVSENLSPTLTCTHGGEPCIVYSINEQGGSTFACLKNQTATLTAATNASSATRCCVAYGIDRAAYNQDVNAKYDFSIEENLMPTMVAKGANACAYGFYPQMKAECITFKEEKSGCLVNGTNPGYQNGVIDNHYIVRRLTPTECARLQGFPDWWCDDLGIAEPTDEDIAEWRKIFETHAKALGKETKPKTDAQIRKWLINPNSDSVQYKMWGNGVALPCVFYVLNSIIENEQEGCL